MKELTGRVVLLTGAAGMQGSCEARRLTELGAHVVLSDLDVEGGERLAAELGDAAVFVQHDVSDPAAWTAAVSTAEREFGRLDVLVNNAGYIRAASLLDATADDWDRHVAVNQSGIFHGMRAAAPAMMRVGGGVIVNIASTAGLKGQRDLFAYNATKWAVRGMTRSAARDLAPHGIRVNAILPGPLDSPMFRALADTEQERIIGSLPLGRVVDAAEIAAALVFLCSDGAASMTGAEIVVDSGLNA